MRKRLLAYANEMGSGIDPEDIHPEDVRSEQDWPKLPAAARADIRVCSQYLFLETIMQNDVNTVTTGVSTG